MKEIAPLIAPLSMVGCAPLIAPPRTTVWGLLLGGWCASGAYCGAKLRCSQISRGSAWWKSRERYCTGFAHIAVFRVFSGALVVRYLHHLSSNTWSRCGLLFTPLRG